MKRIVFILFISISNLLYPQKITSNIIKYYEFQFCNSPQTLVLVKKKNNNCFGYIKILLKKQRKNKECRKISRTLEISSIQASKIIYELEKNNIDSLSQNYDDDLVSYLDGDFLTIKILKNNKVEAFSFDELYPESKKKIETTPLRAKIQNWLTIIDNNINLKEQLSTVKNKLSKGKYFYYSGINTIYFKNK